MKVARDERLEAPAGAAAAGCGGMASAPSVTRVTHQPGDGAPPRHFGVGPCAAFLMLRGRRGWLTALVHGEQAGMPRIVCGGGVDGILRKSSCGPLLSCAWREGAQEEVRSDMASSLACARRASLVRKYGARLCGWRKGRASSSSLQWPPGKPGWLGASCAP